MHPDRIWISMAIQKLVSDALGGDDDGEEELLRHFQDTVVAAATVITLQREMELLQDGESVDLDFDGFVACMGYAPEAAAKAHGLRRLVFEFADRLIAAAGARSVEDPPCCDPGGGMRHPDAWVDDRF